MKWRRFAACFLIVALLLTLLPGHAQFVFASGDLPGDEQQYDVPDNAGQPSDAAQSAEQPLNDPQSAGTLNAVLQSAEPLELAYGKPVTASSEKTGDGRTAVKAVDGDPATQWESSAVPAHLTIDLLDEYVVNKAAITLGPDWSARTLNYAVEGSLNGTDFIVLSPPNDYRFERAPKNRHEMAFDSVKARYIRFVGVSNSNPNGIQATELQVYQDPDYTPDGGQPELAVTGLTWQPANVFAGDPVLFTGQITNVGSGDYSGVMNLQLDIGGRTVTGTAGQVTLPVGWKLPVASEIWTAAAGSHTVLAAVEGFGQQSRAYPMQVLGEEYGLPDGWAYAEIGSHASPGSAYYSDGMFTVESSGYDLAGSGDEASFVYRMIDGDATLEATLQLPPDGSAGSGSGVMFRAGLGTQDDFIALRLLADGKLQMNMRSGGVWSSADLGQLQRPAAVRLKRIGDRFSAYASEDGASWGTPLASRQLALPNESAGGLVVASRDRGKAVKANFSQVAVAREEAADLIVSEIVLSPAKPKPGDEVAFSATVMNRGAAPTVQPSFKVGFKIDPHTNGNIASAGEYSGVLAPGESVTVVGTAAWAAEPGTHAVLAIADLDGQVEEGNKLNNEATAYVAVREHKAPAQETPFDRRASYILNTFAAEQPQQTDRTLWVKEAIFYAQARFELGIDVETALSIVDDINNNPAGASMFYYTANIDTYLRYGHLYPEALRNKVKQRLLAIDYSNNGSTENHLLKFRTAGFLVAQTWPEWDKAAATKAFAKQDISAMLKRFVAYGMKEYDSTTYAALYLECLLMLHEFSEDAELKRQATMALEWMLANIAGEWVNGYWISSTVRDYNGISPKLGAAGNVMAWLYFGGEERPALRENDMNYPEGMYSVMAAASEYRAPDILSRIAEDRSTPYLHRESHDQHPATKLNYPHGYRKSSYMTEHYGVASQFDGNGTLGWSDQLRRWLVRWVSDEPYSTFFMTHPKRGGIQSGGTPYEQVVQSEGAIVAVYNIPQGDAFPYVNGPFPSALKEKIEHDSGWIFAHGGNMLLAVKPLKPYQWTEEAIGSLTIPVLRSAHLKNGVIVETASPDSYSEAEDAALPDGERRQLQLSRFAQAILDGTEVDASGIDNANPSIVYTSLSGNVIGIQYNGDRIINGEAIDYTEWPLIESPYFRQEVGSEVLLIRHGGESLAYDFGNWEVTVPAEGPDLTVSRVSWLPQTVGVDRRAELKATVRNAGLAASPAAGFEVVFKDGDEEIGSALYTGSLAKGESVELSAVDWTPRTVGQHSITAEVRATNWTEGELANNSHTTQITVFGAKRIWFSDDFEDDITSKWDSAGAVGSWSHAVDSDDGRKIMKGSSTATSGNPVRKVAKSTAWEDFDETSRDYMFEFTAKYAGGSASGGTGEQMRALVRFANPQAYYYFDFNSKTGTVAFVKYTTETGFVTLNPPVRIADKVPEFNFNRYNRYAIKAEGDAFVLSINDAVVLETVQDVSVTGGSVGFMNRNSELWIDEVRVESIAVNEPEEPGPVSDAVFTMEAVAGSGLNAEEAAIRIAVEKADDLYGFVLDIGYVPDEAELVSVQAHADLGGQPFVSYKDHGTFVRIVGSRTASDGELGINGDAGLLTLAFKVPAGQQTLRLTLRAGSDYSNSKAERTV
ncbi:CARDB domain-containing protein, partial [Cohnella sp.]|uniref:CARDB domain-containing protein n=1 Tax=Cohnella sp. TaxID=1883426 RepID=UPI00356936E1